MTKGFRAYSGDISIEHGGFYMQYEFGDDYALILDVTPWSSYAGAPDNVFLIEGGSVYLDSDHLQEAMECCGYDRIGPPTPQAAIELIKSYAGFDRSDCSQFVQIGKDVEAAGVSSQNHHHMYLGANTDLRGFVESVFLGRWNVDGIEG